VPTRPDSSCETGIEEVRPAHHSDVIAIRPGAPVGLCADFGRARALITSRLSADRLPMARMIVPGPYAALEDRMHRSDDRMRRFCSSATTLLPALPP